MIVFENFFSFLAMIFRSLSRNDAQSASGFFAVVMKLSHSSLGVCDLEVSIPWSLLCSFIQRY